MTHRNNMASGVAAVSAIFIMILADAHGHDTWLLPKQFRAAKGQDVHLDLTSGMKFPEPDHPIKPDRVDVAGWRLAGKTDLKLRSSGAEHSLRLATRPSSVGVATAWVTLKPRPIELNDKQVAEYLDEIGAAKSVRKAWADAGPGRRWREVYTKHAKTFVRVGESDADRSWSEPVGQALEIVPGADPTALRAGDKLPLRVLKGGKPLPGFALNLIHGAQHVVRPQVTDQEGRATVELAKTGRWLLAGTELRHVRGKETNWESDFATLTVEVGPKQLKGAVVRYQIQTLAGNGKPGDLPKGGGLATDVSLDLPFGVENGPDSALYITTVGSHRVLRLDRRSGKVTSVAGSGRKGFSGDGGPATEAALNEPYEVRFDSPGNMFIVDMQNHAIRRVDAKTGVITTVAGDGTAGDRGDGGPARGARLRAPHSITFDGADNLYISDLANHRVRRLDAKNGRIESIIGNGKAALPHDGGRARDEPFLTPQGLAVRGEYLWVASVSGHSLWRLHLKNGTIQRVAGTGKRGHTGDGGDPLSATFDGPRGLTMSPSGVIYLAEGENNVIRAVDTVSGSIRTLAGVGPKQHRYFGDGIAAITAPLWQPHGVCLGADGTLVISDTINHRVRLLVPIGDKSR